MRRTTGILLLGLLSLLSSVNVFRRTEPFQIGSLGRDEISVYLKRFEALRKTLPAHATVGYESDLEGPLWDRDEARRFYLTEYALAPVIIVAGTKSDVVIGNYRDPARNCRICKANDFVLIADFGDGLILFQKKTKR